MKIIYNLLAFCFLMAAVLSVPVSIIYFSFEWTSVGVSWLKALLNTIEFFFTIVLIGLPVGGFFYYLSKK